MSQPENIIHIIQGQFHVSNRPGDVLATVLGSCVAACLYDPENKVGGMNHFLLPGSDPNAGSNVKYGAHSMEMLINTLIRKGAMRNRIEAQLFGGGNVVKGISRIGESNASFARKFVMDEGLKLTKTDLGGKTGRRVRFNCTTGFAKVQVFNVVEEQPQRPTRPAARPTKPVGEVELF
ncbi:Chemotaxis protein CheD [Candidatus Rhodobacter oscarellae]|uniref:Probable chemoreceptor glutamine deamidase CheD n=1 Tax=Candidatus Rhodobacter oscarellae TaxID=1675527 RepID=A0A0J9EDC7_9RHOB|nr:chemotaxis protein CheD [Candidatus Rhodobacter lobularis]KMW60671.1 Chemotaxis protein CheD [Candidatus Rhodobacter lobularis]